MRRPRLLLSCVLVALVALLAGGCGDAIAPAAAEVNGKLISEEALDGELEQIRANPTYTEYLETGGNTIFGASKATFAADFVRRVLTRQIYLELVRQEYVRLKLRPPTEADRDLVEQGVSRDVGGPEIFAKFSAAYRKLLLDRSAMGAKLQLELSDTEVTDETVRAFYDQNSELFVQTCSRHILFAVLDGNGEVDTEATEAQSADLQAQATAAKARVDAGEDFAALARELSKDQSNREQGGDLECGGAGRFVPEFETALDGLQPGQVSPPVKTNFGWHLMKVDSRDPQPFEEVAEAIREQLLGQAQQGFGTFIGETVNAAEITVNPRYGKFSKEGQQPGVIAPSAPSTPDVGGPTGSTGEEPLPIDLGG